MITDISNANGGQSFYCLDRYQDLEIFGLTEQSNVALSFDFLACDSSDKANNCAINSIKDLQDYLRDPELMVIHNQHHFDQRFYEETDMITKKAIIKNWHVDKNTATWTEVRV